MSCGPTRHAQVGVIAAERVGLTRHTARGGSSRARSRRRSREQRHWIGRCSVTAGWIGSGRLVAARARGVTRPARRARLLRFLGPSHTASFNTSA
jgi:hypothetical protein